MSVAAGGSVSSPYEDPIVSSGVLCNLCGTVRSGEHDGTAKRSALEEGGKGRSREAALQA
jgi:hypothetical protein